MDSPCLPPHRAGADSRLLSPGSDSESIPSPPQPRRLVQQLHAAFEEGKDDDDGVALLAVNSVHVVMQERLDKAVQKGQVVDLTDDSPPHKPLKTTRDSQGHAIIWLDDDDDDDDDDNVSVEDKDSAASTAASVRSIPKKPPAECAVCKSSIRSTVPPLLCTACRSSACIAPQPRALPDGLVEMLQPGQDSTIPSGRDQQVARRQSSNDSTVEEFSSGPKRARRK